jgi:hypothetical protein
MKIVSATISVLPKDFFDPMPTVTVTFEDGEIKELFEFYPDEISFTESEFVGLTEEEARRLKFTKDRNYLRS